MHFTLRIFFFENRALYEMWENIIKPERPQTIIWRMLIVCCILEATDKHSEYNSCTNAPQCNVIHTLPVLLYYLAV